MLGLKPATRRAVTAREHSWAIMAREVVVVVVVVPAGVVARVASPPPEAPRGWKKEARVDVLLGVAVALVAAVALRKREANEVFPRA